MKMYDFKAEQTKNQLVIWLKDWFRENGAGCNAVIGISGGKDSTVVAALCVEALGKDRVIGVMMPNHIQNDIEDSKRVCDFLGIKNYKVDIGSVIDATLQGIALNTDIKELTDQTLINLPPRIRMATLYALSQSMNGRVINTCNLSETMVSWETRWGDAVGDCAPIVNLTVEEVKKIGYALGLPKDLIEKTPSDGLCGSSDEEALGIKYQEIDDYIRKDAGTPERKAEILKRVKQYEFKRNPIPSFNPGIKNYME